MKLSQVDSEQQLNLESSQQFKSLRKKKLVPDYLRKDFPQRAIHEARIEAR